jgi:hypothetical protein
MGEAAEVLQGKPQNDPEWVKEIASQLSYLKGRTLTNEERILLRELFIEYQQDGLKPKDAIEKAKNILLSFKK